MRKQLARLKKAKVIEGLRERRINSIIKEKRRLSEELRQVIMDLPRARSGSTQGREETNLNRGESEKTTDSTNNKMCSKPSAKIVYQPPTKDLLKDKIMR